VGFGPVGRWTWTVRALYSYNTRTTLRLLLTECERVGERLSRVYGVPVRRTARRVVIRVLVRRWAEEL
jgi:hypothetical protein